MKDIRNALKNGSKINWSEDKKIWINGEISRETSCIVYEAIYMDSIGSVHNIRIKECYPNYLSISRTKEGELLPFRGNEDKFELIKEKFIQIYQKNIIIRSTLHFRNLVIDYTEIIYFNNTIYIIIVLDKGISYKTYEEQSLKELLVHIKSLAKLIQVYHKEGYVHLNIKPENVFILQKVEDKLLLFDFNSFISYEELKDNGRFWLSFSDGFSAPELIQGKINKIGRHTDIYSIGALTFYKMFGKKVTLENCRISSIYNFEEMKFASKEYQDELYKMLEKFFRKTLSTSIISRWKDMEEVIEQLEDLIELI